MNDTTYEKNIMYSWICYNKLDSSNVSNLNDSYALETPSKSITENEAINWDIAQISVIVAILTFVCGFFINEAIRRSNKAKEISIYKKFINEWINESDSSLNKYIDNLTVFSENIKKNNDLNIVKWKSNIIPISKISNISIEKYVDIFLHGNKHKDYHKKRKELMNLLYYIEYIEKAHNSIMMVYEEYVTNNDKIMDEWNLNYMQLHKILFSYFKLGSYTLQEQTIIESIFNSFWEINSESKGEFIGMDKWYNDFIMPNFKLLTKDSAIMDNSIILNQILELINGLRVVYLKHNKHKEYSMVFNDYVINLNKSRNKINESIAFFATCKTRRFVR